MEIYERLEKGENCEKWVSCESFSNGAGRLMQPAHFIHHTCQITRLLYTNTENYLAAIFTVVTINTIFISTAF
jgi:hypothetical protein